MVDNVCLYIFSWLHEREGCQCASQKQVSIIPIGLVLNINYHGNTSNKYCIICKLSEVPKAVADLGGVRGVQMYPPLVASNVFCIHNCTSPSNDYAAVACSNNNHTLTYQFLPDLQTFD